MQVTKIVDEDIEGKIDIQYVEKHLSSVPNVAIAYICTSEGGEEDEWIDDESGIRFIVIHLPYKVIKGLTDARPFMLARAKERLGLVAETSLN